MKKMGRVKKRGGEGGAGRGRQGREWGTREGREWGNAREGPSGKPQARWDATKPKSKKKEARTHPTPNSAACSCCDSD